MPAIKNDVLQDAVDATYQAAGPQNIEFEYSFNGFTQVVHNYTNWEVCHQYPAAGEAVDVSPKPYTVYLYIGRPNTC